MGGWVVVLVCLEYGCVFPREGGGGFTRALRLALSICPSLALPLPEHTSHHPRSVYKKILKRKCPIYITGYLHSQWFITKPRLLAIPRKVWKLVLDLLGGQHPPTVQYSVQAERAEAKWRELKAQKFLSATAPDVLRLTPTERWHHPEMIARHRYDAEVIERVWPLLFLEPSRMPLEHGFALRWIAGNCTPLPANTTLTRPAIFIGNANHCNSLNCMVFTVDGDPNKTRTRGIVSAWIQSECSKRR